MIKHYIYHLSLSLYYLKDRVIVYRVQIFYCFQNIVSILYYEFIEFIILLYTAFFLLLKRNNILINRFHLVSLQMYYLLLFVVELLVIFEAFVYGLIWTNMGQSISMW